MQTAYISRVVWLCDFSEKHKSTRFKEQLAAVIDYDGYLFERIYQQTYPIRQKDKMF